MATVKITLYGMAKYMEDINDDLFYNLSLPTSDLLDKDTFIKSLLLKGGEFEVLYADPFFMKDAIGVWSSKWERTISKWCDALALEYEPIENYDRHEDWTDTSEGSASDASKVTSESSSEDKNAAYNSSTYEPDTKNEASGTTKNIGNSTTSAKSSHSARIHGNIGVTTSQQMLEAELQLDAWSLYDHVMDLFLAEFILPVY